MPSAESAAIPTPCRGVILRPRSTFNSPDLIFSIHSKQYTGRPGVGLNGTLVSLPQFVHTVGYICCPLPLLCPCHSSSCSSSPPPSVIPLQRLISSSTVPLGFP